MNFDNNLSLQFRELSPHIETTIREVPKSGIEVDIIEELPSSDQANAMTSLENALLEKFGYEPKEMSETERNQAMDQIRPNIKSVRGGLPRAEENKAESPVQFETYVAVPRRDKEGNVILDSNGNPKPFLYGLQAKVKWEVEVDLNGKREKIQFFQNIRAQDSKGSLVLPRRLTDLAGIEHAKHKALLYLKTFTRLHKKGLMGDNYQLDNNIGKAVVVESLVKNLRATNRLKMTHYPNPLVYRSLYRAGTGLSVRDGAASDTEVHLGNYKISLGHSEEMDIKGRKLQRFKPGDDLPNGAGKAEVVMTKYVKVNVPNPRLSYQRFYDPKKEIDPHGVAYGTHLYQMASKATINGPPMSSYENMAKSASQNLKGEIAKDANVEIGSYRSYETRLMQNSLEDFEKEEKQLRMNLLDLATNGNPGIFQSLFLNDSKVKGLADGLASQFQALTANNSLPELKKLYEQSRALKQEIQNLEAQKAKIEKGKDHIEQLGPKEGATPKKIKSNETLHKALLGKIDRDLANVDKKLQLYTGLEQQIGLAEQLLREKNM